MHFDQFDVDGEDDEVWQGLDPLDTSSLPLETGRLLLAAPMLTDPNFRWSVVLVLDHDEDGTLGLIINRPSQIEVQTVLPAWSGLTTGTSVLFAGGPVADDSALGLGDLADVGPEPPGFRRVTGTLGLVDLDIEQDALPLRAVRVFAGYAGWAPDQLQSEIAEGAWYVVTARSTDAFTDRPDLLWRTVLARQTGALALLANRTDTPESN